MNTGILIVVAVIIIVALALFIRAMANRGTPIVNQMLEMNINPEERNAVHSQFNAGQTPTLENIRAQIRAGNKIIAIKLYRQKYGVGLKEAKDAVERMERENAWEPTMPPQSPATPFNDDGPGPSLDDIRTQIRAGNKIIAIKLYRQRYGVGLKEAKDAVERMERESTWEPGISAQSPEMSFPEASFPKASLNNEGPGPSLEDIRAQIRAGNKIIAIKLYRQKYGVGLKEAKDAVEYIERELPGISSFD